MKSARKVELLPKNGANPQLRNWDGETMLDLAKKYGIPEIVILVETPVEQDKD